MPILEAGQITPQQFVLKINQNLPYLSPGELARLKIQARAWATVFHEGEIPTPLEQKLTELEAQHGFLG